MLVNLKAEMTRYGIKGTDIARETGLSGKVVWAKLKGEGQFSVADAVKIRDKFFPAYSLEYLFSDEPQENPGPKM